MTCVNAKRQGSRPAKPGEKCACGEQAKEVLIRELGEVPTCVSSEDYAKSLEHVGAVARGAVQRLQRRT